MSATRPKPRLGAPLAALLGVIPLLVGPAPYGAADIDVFLTHVRPDGVTVAWLES